MTYNMLSGTLSLYALSHYLFDVCLFVCLSVCHIRDLHLVKVKVKVKVSV